MNTKVLVAIVVLVLAMVACSDPNPCADACGLTSPRTSTEKSLIDFLMGDKQQSNLLGDWLVLLPAFSLRRMRKYIIVLLVVLGSMVAASPVYAMDTPDSCASRDMCGNAVLAVAAEHVRKDKGSDTSTVEIVPVVPAVPDVIPDVSSPVDNVDNDTPQDDKSNNGNHYGNDKPDNNDKDNAPFDGDNSREDFEDTKEERKDNPNK